LIVRKTGDLVTDISSNLTFLARLKALAGNLDGGMSVTTPVDPSSLTGTSAIRHLFFLGFLTAVEGAFFFLGGRPTFDPYVPFPIGIAISSSLFLLTV
jgi:hypothetical protein